MRTIPGFGDDTVFSHKLLPLLLRGGRAKRNAKAAEVVVPSAARYEVRDMEEFAVTEGVIFARLRAELKGATPVLDYAIPHQQHYVVLVDERGGELRSRVLSQTTVAYEHAKDVGGSGTLGAK